MHVYGGQRDAVAVAPATGVIPVLRAPCSWSSTASLRSELCEMQRMRVAKSRRTRRSIRVVMGAVCKGKAEGEKGRDAGALCNA